MGLFVVVLVGVLVASVQILVRGTGGAERVRQWTLAALAAFFGGCVVKAVTLEPLSAVSLGSVAVAAAASAAILLAWHVLVVRPETSPAHSLRLGLGQVRFEDDRRVV